LDVTTIVLTVLLTLLVISGIAFVLAPRHALQAAGAGTIAGGVGGLLSWGVCMLIYPAGAPYCAIAGGVSSAVTSVIVFSLSVTGGVIHGVFIPVSG